MHFVRFSVLVIVAATLAGCSLSPQQWQETTSPAMIQQCEPPEKSYQLDQLRLTILDVNSLRPGCVTQVIYRYRRDAWSHMFPDEAVPNRFLGAVQSNISTPAFLIQSICKENGTIQPYDYPGRIEVWRQSIGGPWVQLSLPPPTGDNN